MDQMLSQEEINALLGSIGGDEEEEATQEEEYLTSEEKDAIGEISNISMGTAATTLSTLLNQRVNITTPNVSLANWDDISNSYTRPCVFIQISYIEGLDGNNVLILREDDVKIITDLMMGGDGTNTTGELTDLHLSAISEAMNQMMGSAATSISSMLEKKVDISPPSANVVDLNDIIDGSDIAEFLRGRFVKVSFHMEIGDLVNSQLMQLYPFEFARDLYHQFIKYTGVDESAAESINVHEEAGQGNTASQNDMSQMGMMPNGQMMYQQQMGMMPNGQMMYQQPMGMMPNGQMGMYQPQEVNIAPAQFQPFMMAGSPLLQTEHIDLLLDVPLEVTVELGRTSKSIKEILDFSPGTIIELNRLAGEPIDVLVNGKYVAKGEVVVIEEAFGIRVTEIVKDK